MFKMIITVSVEAMLAIAGGSSALSRYAEPGKCDETHMGHHRRN